MRTLVVVIAAVLAAAGPASSQQASSQPMSHREDLTAEKAIEMTLQKDPDLRNNRVEVEVDAGVATLKGRVDSEAERAKAEKAAWVKGVTHVDDWLIVHRVGKGKVSDGAVTKGIETQYQADKTLGHSDIFVDTNDGVVTLTGVAPSESARRRAVEVAEESPGVTRVEDRLRAVGEAEPLLP
jgi:hyperosmotically inducible protein